MTRILPPTGMPVSEAPLRETSQKGFESCIPHLRAFARSLCDDGEKADALVVEAFQRALTELPALQSPADTKIWLFSILRALHARDRKAESATAKSAVSPAKSVFRRALSQIDDRQREALVLVVAAGLSHEEASRVCECRVEAVRNRLLLARRSIKRIMRQHSADYPHTETRHAAEDCDRPRDLEPIGS